MILLTGYVCPALDYFSALSLKKSRVAARPSSSVCLGRQPDFFSFSAEALECLTSPARSFA